ncbi:hypothetical protein QR680_003882 [Steinernema hermaphroditum]|uniref:CUB domain-containing protein n=1 Tax=Steinernema hermaphroditum TaxID=289476 RepID=A0AA39HLX2_9BILA|nr:hypothetical protein QR680_003882 [Steinernema hermaphroditum]
MATIRWKSDGNYGRAGFRIHADVTDCECIGEKIINLDKYYNNAAISPSIGDYYCPGMDCQWTITAPENSILILELNGDLRGQCFSKTNGFGDSLEISDGATTYKPQCAYDHTALLPFYNKNLSINFKSSDRIVKHQDENGYFDIKASYVDLVSLKNKNTVRFFNDSTDSVFFTTSALKEEFSSVTFALSNELSSKKLQLYAISTEDSLSSIDNVLIMDGDLSNVASLTSIYDLLHNATVARPITSTSGSITVVLPDTSSIRHSAAMFLKVFDDSRDCSEANSVFSAPPCGDTFQTTYTAKSQNSNLIVCPLMIVKLPGSPGDALNLGINDIQGSDKSVKVLPGVEHNAIPFYEVSKKNLNLWDSTFLYGNIFTILLPVETTLNFTISKTQISGDQSIEYNGHKMGIFMTPNYPNGDSSKQNITWRAFKLTYGDYYKTFKAKFDVFGSLSPSSSLYVLADKKRKNFSATSETKLQSSYDTGYASTVSFVYNGPEGEKGFFIRYEVIPKGVSFLSLSGTVVMIMAMFHLVMS